MSRRTVRRTGGGSSAGARVLAASLLAAVVAWGAGCATGVTRLYNHASFRPNEHFRVQFLLPEGMVARPVPISSLLLLPLLGFESEEQSTQWMLAIWQELQQNLPGIVRTPRSDGLYAPYTSARNLVMDDGRIDGDELERIGRLAGASHLLVVRVISYRPYPPQSIIMEWTLLDVKEKQPVLILAGAMDASEQKVLNAANNYVNDRRSNPSTSGNIDVVLRSPREYSRFVSAQAADSLKAWLRPANEVFVPYLSY